MLKYFASGIIAAMAFLLNPLDAQNLASRNESFSQPLMEVFSGINCNFCEAGDQAINSLVTSNGSCPVNIIEYHSGVDAKPANANQIDLRTSCGTDFSAFCNITATPLAFVNRNIGNLKIYPEWGKAFNTQKTMTTPVNLGMKTEYNKTLKRITITVEIFPLASSAIHECILSLKLIENNVVGYQKMFQGNDNYNYAHKNVLRASITSCFGDTLRNIASGVATQFSYTYNLPEYVNPDEARVIGFITDANDPVQFFTSESIAATGGQTFVDGTLSNDLPEELLSYPDQDIVSNLSYQSNGGDHEMIQFKTIYDIPEFWDLIIDVEGEKFKDTATVEFKSGEIKNIQITFKTNGFAGFADFELVVVSKTSKSPCPSVPHSKKLKCKPAECSTIVVYNTSKRTDGLTNQVNLWKPITDALDCFLCKDYVVMKDYEFERKFTMDTTKIPKAIYYQVGWGIPLVSAKNYLILRRLMDKGTALFMAGQDISYQMGSSLPASFTNPGSRYFHNIYLSAMYEWNGDSTLHHFSGNISDPIFGKIGSSDISPVYSTSTTLNLFPDVVSSTSANAKKLLLYDDGRICGYYFDRSPHKVILLGIGVEMIADMKLRKDLITTAHIWMLGCDKLISGEKPIDIHPGMEIYPTYSNGLLQINNNAEELEAVLSIYNLEGILLTEMKLIPGIQSIDIHTLMQGIYLYRIVTSKRNILELGKFIKI